ncbi:MAG TPA: acetyl-CoA carboxylase carboxyltransferase subunit alpha [Chloroflexota bacterium]|nr:acetyl-CoA carboxylase carboxyltransferase subunit alpha [Chloroflexota bacterium]
MPNRLDFEDGLDRLKEEIDHLQRETESGNDEAGGKVAALRQRLAEETAELYAGLTPWQKVQVARHPERPFALDYLRWAFTDFVELHGDRRFADDAAIVGGPAALDGRAVMVVGHQKGRGTKENVQRNFGMAHPDGLRKAQRLFKMAESLLLPVITLVDTPGAAVSVADEERGQAEAIATCISVLAGLRVPIVSVIIGEGNSGGALALGVADTILMLEHAYYSVASPEAAASILWRSAAHAAEAAAAMGITAQELLTGGVIDGIIPEPPGGAHRDHAVAAALLRERVCAELDALLRLPVDELLARRYEKYRHLGPFGVATE